MRHGEVSYFDDSGKPFSPDTVSLTEEGRARPRPPAGCSTGVDVRPRDHERPAPHDGDGGDRGAGQRRRGVAGAAGAPGRPLSSIPAGRARGRVRPRLPRGRPEREALPRRRVDRRAVRPRPARPRPAARRRELGHRARSSCTAPSTARSSPTRSPASARSSGISSRRPAASTCSTSATSGSCARSTSPPTDLAHRPTRRDHDGALLGALPGETGSAERSAQSGDGAGEPAPSVVRELARTLRVALESRDGL